MPHYLNHVPDGTDPAIAHKLVESTALVKLDAIIAAALALASRLNRANPDNATIKNSIKAAIATFPAYIHFLDVAHKTAVNLVDSASDKLQEALRFGEEDEQPAVEDASEPEKAPESPPEAPVAPTKPKMTATPRRA